jgi:glycosyltransferase involved in cell wall biosynthesis
MNHVFIESLARYQPAQWAAAIAMQARSTARGILGQDYRAFSDTCWLARVSTAQPWRVAARKRVLEACAEALRSGRNPLVEAFRADPESHAIGSLYAITGKGKHDVWRDIIVLKGASADEKGVVLIKYARTFSAVVALFDIDRLRERYTFVLEPCWAGLCNPSVLLWLQRGHPVIVEQCTEAGDHEFISSVGPPFTPVRLSSADWVDSEAFAHAPQANKAYDIVMVANWGKHKRHATLFRALEQFRDRDLRVLLIGFPWAGRTIDDIRAETARITNRRVTFDIRENIPHREVATLVGQSKVFVFLTRKEGDNKSVVEAMFADVPALVYDKTVGGTVNRINPQTGMLASDEELAAKLRHMLDHHQEFAPRRWALEHSGSRIATQVLDDTLRGAVRAAGGRYERGIVQKTNNPNLAYKNAADRAAFEADYEFIKSCLLPRWRA